MSSREDLIPAGICGHEAEESWVEAKFSEAAFQFAAELRRVNEGTILGRGSHARDLKAIKVFRRVGEGNVQGPHRIASIVKHPPNRFCAPGAGIQVTQ